jgi:hypothetical protein
MNYEARLVDVTGGVANFEFEADNNALASSHLARCSADRAMMDMTFEDCGLQYTKVVRADFRRPCSDHWKTSVDITHMQ